MARLNELEIAADYKEFANLILSAISSFLDLHHLYNNEYGEDGDSPPSDSQKAEYVKQMKPFLLIFDAFNIPKYEVLDYRCPPNTRW